jgi:LuxR family transcriptional regulator, maltose regulon positive regulatory protein
MARTTPPPLVDQTHLLHPESAATAVPVGSPAWYAWLADATSFVFRSQHGTFTAHKEQRGLAREYWKAYRRRSGRLLRVYLGKSSELTLDRLNAAAAELEHKQLADAPPNGTAGLETIFAPADLAESVTNAGLDFGARDGGLDLAERTSAYSVSASSAPDDAQSLHLLTTKLSVPTVRAALVPRARLANQIKLAMSQQHKLILISAPAGFGKTTLIAEWIASRSSELRAQRSELEQAQIAQSPELLTPSWRVAWLALDDTDNHLGQFIAYLIAALETARPTIGAEAWTLLRTQAPHPPTHVILTSLVNALAAPADRIVLVLDDYHTITVQAIHDAVAFLLERQPAHMQIVITTRADPPLPLARLRARGQLTELRAADLRFTGGEAAYLIDHIHGIALAPDAMAALEARTEGWATGLQLAALSLRRRAAADMSAFLADFTGSHSYVFDYLADEVFQQQPSRVRTFLVQTAVLGRLCGPLCAAVTGQNDAQALLEELEQANLFLVRLDNNRRWYRYHHLFHDFVGEQLERTLEPAERADLCLRASGWFEQQGLVDEAIGYALSARAWGDALRCMTPLMASQRFYEYYLDWPRWLAALPDAALVAELDLCRRLAWILIFTGHVEAADRPLTLAEAAWRSAGDHAKVGELLGLRALAWGWKGNFARAIQAAQQALTMLPPDAADRQGVPAYVLGASDLELGHIGSATDWLIAASAVTQRESLVAQNPVELFLSLAAAASLARAYQLRGDLQHAAALYRDVIKRMGSASYLQVPSALIYYGSLYYEWNDLAAAEQMLNEGIAVAKRIGRDRYWPSAWGRLARVLWAGGRAQEAMAMAEHALAVARALDNPPDIAEAGALQGWLWLAQGDLAAAQRWLETHALTLDAPSLPMDQAGYLVLVRIHIIQAQQAPGAADLSAIVSQLERLLQLAEADQRMADRITILALLALAHSVDGASTQALALLVAALRLAQPAGYIRTFVDEGAPMRALLQALRRQRPSIKLDEKLLAYVDQLLAAFPAAATGKAGPAPAPTFLSEREHAVLDLLAAGRSIPEIASMLVISAHTARTHVKNIYAKLEAHNRVQAIDRARTLQLLR